MFDIIEIKKKYIINGLRSKNTLIM